jgi:pimeloyl-ACP methyl ester carboxylesterase
MVGRGRSDWLADPAGYGYPQYCADMAALIARLGVERVDWVGTSMGGLIGMMLAAQPNTPIARLAINDVGPFIPKAALERIAAYLGKAPAFADLGALEAYLREVHAPFGALTDAQWAHLAEHSARPAESGAAGAVALHYDPAIRVAFEQEPLADVDLWPLWDAVACPTLVLRGAESDLLPARTAAEMATRGPHAEIAEIEGCGHAPALMDEQQTGLVRDWLAASA